MHHPSRLFAALVLAGCAPNPPAVPLPAGQADPIVVLVSLDGFRWDYLDRGLSPNLARLARDGVRAQALVPVFPTKTFPNHYAIVTGRYPVKNGIVGNKFTDPELGAKFSMWDREAVRDSRFWEAEPIWVTAEKQGRRTAPFFWPGSEAAIQGVRPTFAVPFDNDVPDTARVRRVLGWLDLPADRRPSFLTLYFGDVDHAGHRYGPGSPQTDSAIALTDSMIGLLVAGLSQRGLTGSVDLVVVSDHGMAATGPDRVVWLDDYVDSTSIEVDEQSPLLTAWPDEGLEDSVYRGLRRAPHLTVYRRAKLPPRFRLEGSPRVPPIVALADEGWTLEWRAAAAQARAWSSFGNHGYDDSLPVMRAIFIAHGPAFRRGLVVPPFRNIHIYPLLAEVLGLHPAPTDGTLDSVRVMLSSPLPGRVSRLPPRPPPRSPP